MKKKLIIALLLLLLGGACYGYYNYQKNMPEVKVNQLSFEYGQEVDIQQIDLFKEAYPLTDLVCNFAYKDEQKYPEVGEYQLTGHYTYFYKEYTLEIPVTIKDTTAPKVSEAKEEISIPYGKADYDFKKEFKIEDLSNYEMTFDLTKVDFKEAGIYLAKAIITDEYNNKTEHDFKVRVEKEEEKIVMQNNNSDDEDDDDGDYGYHPAPSQSNNSGITYVDGILIVNKKYSLPEDYNPGENPTAGAALRELLADAQAAGLDIGDYYSGFRSYDYQYDLYWKNVGYDGQAVADTYSARPGHSEHQTGLAFDLCYWNGQLIETNPEVNWVAKNAHKYGFIVRYTAAKQHITGYMDEPWHIRYVGDIATDIYNSGLCLEEYLGVEGGDYNY